eukprot:CAMPEP_0174716088 /NCGR_PEP_ID=MMETSP1094-20130205/22811_1 /TAXON_ID=156173 /ORGANISM="Chrysochromulina brevifilum, Strain UTEX LB 985" /LENGTH=53 /DNA_ID=CAMNT_0015915767 /DNA_START=247 /DNA_END=405 /DNA_ORIENTATION=-
MPPTKPQIIRAAYQPSRHGARRDNSNMRATALTEEVWRRRTIVDAPFPLLFAS